MSDGADFDLVGFSVSNGDQVEAAPSIGINLSVVSTDNTNGATGTTSISFNNLTVNSVNPTDAGSVNVTTLTPWSVDATGTTLDGVQSLPIAVSVDATGFSEGLISLTGMTVDGIGFTEAAIILTGVTVDAIAFSEGIISITTINVNGTGFVAGIINISGITVDGYCPSSAGVEADVTVDIDAVALAGAVYDVDCDITSFNVSSLGVNNTDISIEVSVSGSLLTGGVANGGVILSGFGVDSSGSGTNVISTDMSVAFSVLGTVISQNIGAAGLTLNSFNAQGVGLTGGVGQASVDIVLDVDSTAYAAILYTSSISITSLAVDALGAVSLPDTGFKVVVVNPEVGGDSATEYDNYDFNSFALFNGVYYGASSGGLFDISGATDAGSPIASRVLMGIADYNAETQIYMPYTYLTYRTDGDLEIITRTNESIERVNAAEWNQDTGIHEKRVLLNPGVLSRQWQIGFQNVDGADFEIAAIRPLPMATERRIK